MRDLEFAMKRFVWIAGFSAALSLKAGDFLGKGDNIVRPSRVGEHQSSPFDPEKTPVVAPAQRPGSGLAEQVDPKFAGSRSPGPAPVAELRFRPTGIANEYLIEEVDPQGPYGHRFKKGDKVKGEDLGL